MEYLTKQLYAAKSEKLDPNQLEIFDESVEMGKPEPLPDVPELEGESSKNEEKTKSRKTKADVFPKNLRVEVVEEITPPEVEANPEDYEKISERHHDLLHHQRAELYWQRKVTGVYKKKSDREEAPISAPAPEPPIEGAMITPELAAQIVIAKYCDHLPHYRQAGIWKREQDINLSRQTINTWTHAIANHLRGIAAAIGRELRASDVLQLDETPIDYLKPGHGKCKKGYYWVMRDPQSRAVYYHWEITRSKEGLKRTLGWDEESNTLDYIGTIQCDGYSAYQSLQKELNGIQLGGCLAHIRRKFLKDESNELWVAKLLRQIQVLYRIERELKGAPPDERRRIRQKQSKPIVDRLKATFITQKPNYRPKSNIGEAITYALGQWAEFEQYLENGKLEIDNNGVENAIRPTKLGAKNHLFIGSAGAGTKSAILYTLIENCGALGLNPRDYLVWAIKEIKSRPAEELTPAQMARTLKVDRRSAA